MYNLIDKFIDGYELTGLRMPIEVHVNKATEVGKYY